MALPFLGIISDVIEKIVPDADTRMQMKAQAAQMEHDGQFKELEIRMNAIVMEAQSKDPWTSRARPGFLYVMYVFILSAIPMGFLFAFKPEIAQAVTQGVQGWLQAIPGEMWALFGAGYLGYTQARSGDKARQLGQEPKGLMSKILG